MRKMQSTARGGELLPGGTPPRNSVLGSGSADPNGFEAVRTGADSERLPGACDEEAGMDSPDETLQQGAPSGFT
jgi:hypothetical protein